MRAVQNPGDGSELGAWLLRQRQSRCWSMREQARRLIEAGRDAGDTSVPSVHSMCRNVSRWERGLSVPLERYRLWYCRTWGISAGQFGIAAISLPREATVNASSASVSLRYTSGRLVIEISGLDVKEILGLDADQEPQPALTLVVPSQPVPRGYQNTEA